MERKSPVYNVIAVPVEKIKPNTYNPNKVAPPEMKLLQSSLYTATAPPLIALNVPPMMSMVTAAMLSAGFFSGLLS